MLALNGTLFGKSEPGPCHEVLYWWLCDALPRSWRLVICAEVIAISVGAQLTIRKPSASGHVPVKPVHSQGLIATTL